MSLTASTAAHLRTREMPKRFQSRSSQRALAFYLFLAPWLAGLVFLWLIPLTVGLLMSTTNYDGLNLSNVKFLGLQNYQEALSDPDTLAGFGRTVIWVFINLPLWLCGSFGLALLLNQSIRARGVFRTLFYLPSILPPVAIAWIWKIFLDGNYGTLNGILGFVQPGIATQWLGNALALPSILPPVAIALIWKIFLDGNYGTLNGILGFVQPGIATQWLGNALALPSISAIATWTSVGAGSVIFLAGLQSIPVDLEEAARIDGASRFGVMRYVTIPLMTPIIFFQLILGLISGLQAFIFPMLIYGGGVGGGINAKTIPQSINLYMINAFKQVFTYQRFGYGTALIWMLFVIVLGVTFVLFMTSRYWVYSETDTPGGIK